MNDNKPLSEDILLDRLVDGELSGSERRQLLESFDKRPEGWRRCALAFLEAQSWREEMGQVARGLASETNEPKSPASSVGAEPEVELVLNAQLGSRWRPACCWRSAWAVMHRDRGHSIAGGSSNPSGQIASVDSAEQFRRHPTSSKPGDAVTLFVKDDGGRMQPVRVPLVDANTLDKELGVQFQSGVPGRCPQSTEKQRLRG